MALESCGLKGGGPMLGGRLCESLRRKGPGDSFAQNDSIPLGSELDTSL